MTAMVTVRRDGTLVLAPGVKVERDGGSVIVRRHQARIICPPTGSLGFDRRGGVAAVLAAAARQGIKPGYYRPKMKGRGRARNARMTEGLVFIQLETLPSDPATFIERQALMGFQPSPPYLHRL